MDFSLWGCRESDTTERLPHTRTVSRLWPNSLTNWVRFPAGCALRKSCQIATALRHYLRKDTLIKISAHKGFLSDM